MTKTQSDQSAVSEPTTKNKPNILFLMTEQHRGDCLGIERHPVLQTPNMDALAAGGVRFSHAYSTCPTCIPARRSLLSGQFPATHGMVGYRDGIEWNAPTTLPGALRAAGYHTYLVGRDMHQMPRRKRYGYDHMVTHHQHAEMLLSDNPESGGRFGAGVTHNDWTAHPWPLEEHRHDTNWTVNRALEFLKERDPSSPFFLTVSFLAAHPPLQPPQYYFDRYLRTGVPNPFVGEWADRPPNDGLGLAVSDRRAVLENERLLSARAAYYGLINHVDDQIRRLLSPLVSGIDFSNTIVVFTSDHGEMLGDHYMWHKMMPYEGSAHVPMLFSVPKRFGVRAGTVCDQPVCLEDLMPTLLELAGVPIPDSVEGRSLLPLMRVEDVRWRKHLHIEHAPIHQTLTDGEEKYIWFVEDGREQLFDLKADPHELRDLSSDPDRASRMEHWRREMVRTLAQRSEGFVEGDALVAGRQYQAMLPHARPKETPHKHASD